MIVFLSLEARYCLSICRTVLSVEAETESILDVFLCCSYISFLCVSLAHVFFLSDGTKKAPRAVRGSLSASFDDMILTHFCSVCIRVFRQDSDDCASLLGSTLLSRYLHCYADSSTCYCQAHTQAFQLLPNRKLNLFSMVFFVTHIFPFFVSLWRTFFSIERYEKSPPRRARELLCIFRRYDSNTLLCGSHPRF